MKRFIRDIILFVLFFVPAYIVGVYLYGRILPSELRPNLFYNKSMYGTTKNMLSDLEKEKRVDILFIGASDAYRSYDTRIFAGRGFHVFNAGSSSQTPLQTFLLLRDNIDRLKPKLVVYEVSPVCMELDGVESTTDLIVNGYSCSKTFPLVFRHPEIHTLNSYLFNVSDQLFARRQLSEFSSDNENYILRGYVEMRLRYNNEQVLPKRNWKPSATQVNSFKSIIHLLKEKNTPYLLVNAPSLTDNSYLNKEAFDSLMSISGNFINGLKFNGFHPSEDFFDPSHLNQNGVKKWNQIIIDRVLDKRVQ